MLKTPTFVESDGGRTKAGYTGDAGDCVTRSIAIATGIDYQEVYDNLTALARQHTEKKRDKIAKHISKTGHSPRNGVHRPIYDAYLKALGWVWYPTMTVGSGCTTHLTQDELPTGRLIVRVSKHMTAVIDGTVHDTHDCSREGKRCVYGYYKKA